jgi:2-keto-4-pentenoate hydratase
VKLETTTALEKIARELQTDLDARSVRRVYAENRGPSSVEEAYQLQFALRKVRETRGEKVVGFKIGFTSPSVRKKAATVMGLTESVHGYLWDTEAYPSGAIVDHRRLGIEGELAVTLLSLEGDDVSHWEVEYEPIIEVHMMGINASTMWDGPAAHDNGRRGLELIGTNCIHAGVVHCAAKKRCLLGEVPLESPMTVHIGGEQIEQVTLTGLEIDGMHGPVGTISWLLKTLRAEGNGDESLIREGTLLLCSTPGGLYAVPPGVDVSVEFEGLTTTCVADDGR